MGVESQHTEKIERVIRAELAALAERRRCVNLPEDGRSAIQFEKLAKNPHGGRLNHNLLAGNLFGLALSGGGLRSAMFNLGLLQALTARGLFKYLDYVSAVSGGSYIAGYLTASAVGYAERKGENFHSWKQNPFRTENGGKLQPSAREFQYGGTYLLKPVQFAGGYLMGLALVHATILSLLIAGCTLVALAWRWFDQSWVRDRLELLNWSHDLLVAFYPTAGFLAAWVLVVLVTSLTRDRRPRASQFCRNVAFFCLMASCLVGLMILLGNGIQGGPDWLVRQDLTFQQYLRTPLAALIPLTVPALLFFGRQLLDSAHKPQGTWVRWIFWLVSRGVVAGIPLVLVGFIAQENFSGFVTVRGPQLIRQDVKDWKAFHTLLAGLRREGWLTDERLVEDKMLGELREELAELECLRDCIRGPRPLENLEGGEWAASWGRLWKVLGSAADSMTGVKDDSGWGREVTAYLQKKSQHEQWIDHNWVGYFNASVLRSPRLTSCLFSRLERESVGADAFVRDWAAKHADGGRLTDLWSMRHQILGKASDNLPAHWEHVNPDGSTELEAFNRLLLQALFPSVIRERTEISTPTVIEYDQRARFWWCLLPAGALAVVMLVVSANRSSLHYFYRDRLQTMFVTPGYDPADGKGVSAAPTLEDCGKVTRVGAPYPLIGGALRLFGWSEQEKSRLVYPFLFSPLYCGSQQTGWAQTSQYLASGMTLAEAIAISGAAVSPTVTSDLYAAFLMLFLNLRLGLWLPRPRNASCWRYVPVGRLLWEGLRQPRENWEYCLVADGGIDEFLGLEELLVRRCRLILISDAGVNDGLSEFGVLAAVVRRVRVDHGIRLTNLDDDGPLDVSDLRRDTDPGSRRSRRHFICGRIVYPEKNREGKHITGLLVYVQMTIVGDEDIDLKYFKETKRSFPNDPIYNQFFDEEQVEAYRQLGYHSGESLCQILDMDLNQEPLLSREALCRRLEGAYLFHPREVHGEAPLAGPHDKTVLAEGPEEKKVTPLSPPLPR